MLPRNAVISERTVLQYRRRSLRSCSSPPKSWAGAEAKAEGAPGDVEAEGKDVPGDDMEAEGEDVPGDEVEAEDEDVPGDEVEAEGKDAPSDEVVAEGKDAPSDEVEAEGNEVPCGEAEADGQEVAGEDARVLAGVLAEAGGVLKNYEHHRPTYLLRGGAGERAQGRRTWDTGGKRDNLRSATAIIYRPTKSAIMAWLGERPRLDAATCLWLLAGRMFFEVVAVDRNKVSVPAARGSRTSL
ncbi:hypothetical protein PENSPDRAFT_668833 [Peniophora sp. CONT]|nr:hypothetical protein PENSPDRAFT_668833 [Peniophora sp. CONT]